MARKLRLALSVSALALTLVSFPAQADTGGPGFSGPRSFLSGLWSRLTALFSPFDSFMKENGEEPADKQGDPQGRGYIDPNGTESLDTRG
ncbi:MAG TPA: hypothetical protein VHN15_01300 [Thermoanaerobaculia bacterium]|nr:hypothetical protein [Thermoanaerobaculia bacterium]